MNKKLIDFQLSSRFGTFVYNPIGTLDLTAPEIKNASREDPYEVNGKADVYTFAKCVDEILNKRFGICGKLKDFLIKDQEERRGIDDFIVMLGELIKNPEETSEKMSRTILL